MHKIVIIGSGQVGQTLGYLLHHSRKYKVIGIWSRRLNNARQAAQFIGKNVRIFKNKTIAAQKGDIIFITTSDSAIQQTCNDIFSGDLLRGKHQRSSPVRDTVFRNKIVLHCSGSLSSDILKSAKRHKDVFIASLHPLQTFANKLEIVSNFRGTYCIYEGDQKALAVVRDIIRILGGVPVEIRAKDKTFYHIGCVFASNYLVTLLKTARDFLKQCGFKEKDIFKAIKPLVDSTMKNINTIGIPATLTGPIARGDVLTIKNHIRAMKERLPFYLALYRELGKHTVKIARGKGTITSAQASLLSEIMKK